MRLRFRAMVVLGAVAGGAALAATGVVLWQLQGAWRADTLAQHQRGLALGVVTVREHISGDRVVLQALSESPSIREAAREQDWKALQARVRAMHANAPGFATLFLVDAAGILRAAAEP